MTIIGLAGTNGSGKDSLGRALAEKYDYLFVDVSEFLRAEAKNRGMPIERKSLRTISAEWRRAKGLGVLVDMAVELFDKSGDKYKGLIVSTMRNSGEAQRVKDLGGKLVWIDADPKIRYERVKGRARSAEDNKTYEQFLEEEKTEMNRSGDEATLDLAAVKPMADIHLLNNNKLQTLMAETEKALKF